MITGIFQTIKPLVDARGSATGPETAAQSPGREAGLVSASGCQRRVGNIRLLKRRAAKSLFN